MGRRGIKRVIWERWRENRFFKMTQSPLLRNRNSLGNEKRISNGHVVFFQLSPLLNRHLSSVIHPTAHYQHKTPHSVLLFSVGQTIAGRFNHTAAYGREADGREMSAPSRQELLSSARAKGDGGDDDEKQNSPAKTPASKSRTSCSSNHAEKGAKLMKKVSTRGGSDALFKECLDAIRQSRHRIAPDVDNQTSDAIDKLTQQEVEVIRTVLQRVDPDKKISSDENQDHYIDPFWDPFHRNRALKSQISDELSKYSRLVTAAEARQQRLLIRRSLRRQSAVHDPLSRENMRHHGREEVKKYPVPKEQHEQFWNPSPAMRAVLRNNARPISWRDLHLLHNFVGENGLVLPRRLTHASRYQQRCIFKAICIARRMALFPYDWKPPERERMPIMDPLQYLVDELTQRYVGSGDRRARAMLMIMAQRYTDISFQRFFIHEGVRVQQKQGDFTDFQPENKSFSQFLSKYGNAGSGSRTRSATSGFNS